MCRGLSTAEPKLARESRYEASGKDLALAGHQSRKELFGQDERGCHFTVEPVQEARVSVGVGVVGCALMNRM